MRQFFCILVAAASAAVGARAQTALDWQQVQARFQAANPAVREGILNIDESKAAEITAYLRPNPNLTTSIDQLTPFTFHPYQPILPKCSQPTQSRRRPRSCPIMVAGRAYNKTE
jgi:cobalt-zinc-cadmium efflux system outer membrane protein